MEQQPNIFPTFITNTAAAFSLAAKLPVHSTALYESAAPTHILPAEFTLPETQFPISTGSDPPPYPQLQPSPVPSQSQFSPGSAISPSSLSMMAATQSSPAGGSSIVSSTFDPTSINLQSTTVQNIPPVEPEQSIDDHMSEKLSSLDLGLRGEQTDMSLPLSDINLSLFESENISLSRIMDGEIVVDESNNNNVVLVNKFDSSDNLFSTASTDSFGKLTRHVNKELDTLNMLGLNVGLKSMSSS